MKFKVSLVLLALCFWGFQAKSQNPDMSSIRCEVDFSKKLRKWDGFGFNYVETAQTMNYDEEPQEYGGFSLLDEEEKEEIIDLKLISSAFHKFSAYMTDEEDERYTPIGNFTLDNSGSLEDNHLQLKKTSGNE